jgi:hypothetical protein
VTAARITDLLPTDLHHAPNEAGRSHTIVDTTTIKGREKKKRESKGALAGNIPQWPHFIHEKT